MSTAQHQQTVDEAKAQAFAERMLGAINNAAIVLMTSIGHRSRLFDVLATLRRSGEPHRLNPKVLSERLMLSSAAMTNRLDQLEKRGLIRRTPDPGDRRALLIELTPSGFGSVSAVTRFTVQ